MTTQEYSLKIENRIIKAIFNDLADQTNGSVMIHYGDTVILATVVLGEKSDGDFFPLTVDYEERFYATGKILGSRFVRREGKPSTEAILSGRIVDRTIRPLFNPKMRQEVQVIMTTISLGEEDADVASVIAASLALGTSDIPWNGPVSAIRVSKAEKFLINPTFTEKKNSSLELDLFACGKDDLINMIEVSSQEVSEDTLTEALTRASQEIEKIQTWQHQIIAEIGKQKQEITILEPAVEINTLFESEIMPVLFSALYSNSNNKSKIQDIHKKWLNLIKEMAPEGDTAMASEIFEERVNKLIHDEVINNNRRVDGRKLDEIRPLFAQAGGISPILHGSGIFYRGGTHILSTLTLGSPGDALMKEGVPAEESKLFMHHYNFPPFSTGETGRIGGTNRRMIGHGALAEKALLPIIPTKDKFPYTIRLVSEAFASNGSTSMGSVCGSTLALMDGGVPIKAPVAGIASGLMMRKKGDQIEYKILTDIQGPEDHYGDMDFKVAGTRIGVTAVQMDVKIEGIPIPILTEAFEKAKIARFQILDVIEKEIAAPRNKISDNAPEIVFMKIKPTQIGLVIGSNGKTINEIREFTKVEDITTEDDGSVFITGKNGSSQKAKDFIFNLTREYTAGEKLEGEVSRIMEFGAFVKIGPNTEGLVHISEIAPFRVEKVETYLTEGMKIPVTIKEIDSKGRINLSIKLSNPDFFIKKEEESRSKINLRK